MIPGMIVYGVLIQILLAVFFPLRLYRAAGLWLGILCGFAMAVHMAVCLEKTVLLDEKSANAYAKRTTLIRYACVCLVMFAVAFSGLADPVAFVFGTLGLKIGAYLQPVSHRLFEKFRDIREIDKNSKEGEQN